MRFVHPTTMVFCTDRQRHTQRQFGKLIWLALITTCLGIPSAHAISLPEAIELAIAKSPEVNVAQQQRLILEEQVKQVSSSYYPSVDLSTGFGNERSDNISTRNQGVGSLSLPRTEARLVINQVLFDGFGIANELKRAHATYTAADWVYRGKVQDVSIDAINRYINVQKQRELLDLINTFSDIQKGFLAKIRAWYEGGAGTIADVWQTESRLALTISSVATNESQLGSAIDTFVVLFGISPDNLQPAPPVAAFLPTTLEQALDKAAKVHPSLMENQLNLQAAQAIRDAAQSSLWPSVNLALESNRTTNTNGVKGESQTASAMIRFNYNLFKGGNDLAVNREANSRLQQALEESEQIKRTFRENIEKSWRTLQELRKRLTSLQNHTNISKQVVDAYYEQFFADKRTLLNVLNAENELFTAQSNRVKGYYALRLEEYRFLANLGILNQSLAQLLDSISDTKPSRVNRPLPSDDIPKKPNNTATISWVDEEIIAAQEKHLSTDTTQPSAITGALLRSAKPIQLYDSPHRGGVAQKVAEGTPLCILKAQNGWFYVQNPVGDRLWMIGPVNQDGEPNPDWSSGMITLEHSSQQELVFPTLVPLPKPNLKKPNTSTKLN